ncbi:PsmB [Acrasis kona]|uniref:PsmB n=1 Tax=Acrasis kona TaxID=1008807 RepID=A0AAW2ZG40_9EUKA
MNTIIKLALVLVLAALFVSAQYKKQTTQQSQENQPQNNFTGFIKSVLNDCVDGDKFNGACVKKKGEEKDISSAAVFFLKHAPFKKAFIQLKEVNDACHNISEEECAVKMAHLISSIGVTAATSSVPFAGPYVGNFANKRIQKWIDDAANTTTGKVGVSIVATIYRAIRDYGFNFLNSFEWGRTILSYIRAAYNVIGSDEL